MSKRRSRNSLQDKRELRVNDGVRQIRDKFLEQREIKPLIAKNDRQREALKAFTNTQMVLLSGSAGTGKTELASWWAAKQWLSGHVDNIVITRPYQHLGNDYGAVKGGDSEKLLMFCMSILMKFKKYLGAGVLKNAFKMEGFDSLFEEASGIQIVPVEKIQGMSFGEKTIIIADEIQNATVPQVKSLTTRAEEGCQIIVCGDPRQTALKQKNGLVFLEETLAKYPTELAKVVHFESGDVVRGGLAGHLVAAYEAIGSKW